MCELRYGCLLVATGDDRNARPSLLRRMARQWLVKLSSTLNGEPYVCS